MKVEKPLAWANVIFSIFDYSRKKKLVKPFQALLLRGYSRAIITAHAPGVRMWPSPGPGTNS